MTSIRRFFRLIYPIQDNVKIYSWMFPEWSFLFFIYCYSRDNEYQKIIEYSAIYGIGWRMKFFYFVVGEWFFKKLILDYFGFIIWILTVEVTQCFLKAELISIEGQNEITNLRQGKLRSMKYITHKVWDKTSRDHICPRNNIDFQWSVREFIFNKSFLLR